MKEAIYLYIIKNISICSSIFQVCKLLQIMIENKFLSQMKDCV